jgi:cysteinyl-tRNA synthetase
VRNITDIDDKIINRAKELNIGWQELIKKYIGRYYEDLKDLGIQKGNFEPRATENISDMIKYIKNLIDKGYAYITGTGVYFSVRKFKNYGRLSGQGIDQMLTGVRIEADEQKQDPLDFALWKKSKEDEPFWDSPWGKGRPGWHIECSVMSQKFLKTDTIDIHAGGRDLIFPHHENEIAQSEALTGKPFAKYWIHHGLLTINGQKMAKSLGNFVTIKDFLDKYKDVDILKLFFLSAHYSHPIDYSEEKIEEVKKQKIVLNKFFEKVNLWSVHKSLFWHIFRRKPKIKFSDADKTEVNNICAKFKKAMDGDFNMPEGLSCIFELIDLGSLFVSADKEQAFNYTKLKVEEFFKIFGLTIPTKKKIPKDKIKQLREMEKERRMKNFENSDSIRKKLELDGYAVMTTGSSLTITTSEGERNFASLGQNELPREKQTKTGPTK